MRALLLVVAAAALALPAPAQTRAVTRDWRPEDRTVIRDFRRIAAVAAASDRVFAVTPTALLVWDPQFQRWEGPYEPPEPDLLARVFAAIVDPLDNSLWMARTDGWVHYQPDIRLWDRGQVPNVRDIAVDLDQPLEGIFLRTAAGWVSVPRGGGVAVPAQPPRRPASPTTVEEAIRENPTLQANAAQILTDSRLQGVRYTAAARAWDRRGWFLGTSGLGLLFLPDGAALPQRMTFGLPGERIGAVFSAPGGVWVANDRTFEAEAAITFVASDLSRFEVRGGLPATGLPFDRTHDLTAQDRALWAATDGGVVRIDPTSGRTDRIDRGRGLPDDRVYSIVSRRGVLTAGTARGVVRVTESLQVERIAPLFNDQAFAVYPMHDSVWVATNLGLLVATDGQQALVRPAQLATSPSFQAPSIAVSQLGDTLVALTRDAMLWRSPGTGRWTLGPDLSAVLGRLIGFAPDRGGFWVAGERGVGFARLNTPPMRPLYEGDLPGPVTDLAVDEEYLWVGTVAGLVRFRLDAVRP